MLDTRYPFLRAITDIPGLTDRECSVLSKFAERVEDRTDCQVAFDIRTGRLCVYLRDPSQGIALPPGILHFRTGDGAFDWSILDRLDDICVLVQEGRKPWKRKMLDMEYAAKAEKSARESEYNKNYDTLTRITLEQIRRSRRMWGMGTRYRPSIVVPGTQGVAV